jgi:hypothetical protein
MAAPLPKALGVATLFSPSDIIRVPLGAFKPEPSKVARDFARLRLKLQIGQPICNFLGMCNGAPT